MPESGYSLVFLIVLIALLSTMAAATLPAIGKQIQREKEAELIFRGLQYAEAIRVFHARYSRYPNALDELLTVEPRSIRQLWSDPLADDGRWALILATSGQPQGDDDPESADQEGRDLAQASGPSGGAPATSGGALEPGSGNLAQLSAGPILGVVSREKGQAIRTFMGRSRYEEWRFVANILPKPQVIPGLEVVTGASVENLGKPFPRGLQPLGLAPQAEDLTGGQAPVDLFEDEGGDG